MIWLYLVTLDANYQTYCELFLPYTIRKKQKSVIYDVIHVLYMACLSITGVRIVYSTLTFDSHVFIAWSEISNFKSFLGW